ncbi:hypothetical protein ACI2K4_23750 [Micromonospora sp. NPDC050397]|uniref:hypothetical protein n=1 Tax=Micromonospora sp. NPDC050397 TaxID=3364279 RepID=UPI00384F8CCA
MVATVARTCSTMLGALALAVATVAVPGSAAGAAADPPSVIAEPDTILVPEGTSASFTVRLSHAPSSTLFLGVGIRGSGTWASPPVVIVFTPTNWSTPRPYSVHNIPDADTVDDVAKFTLSVQGYVPDEVVLAQVDDD